MIFLRSLLNVIFLVITVRMNLRLLTVCCLLTVRCIMVIRRLVMLRMRLCVIRLRRVVRLIVRLVGIFMVRLLNRRCRRNLVLIWLIRLRRRVLISLMMFVVFSRRSILMNGRIMRIARCDGRILSMVIRFRIPYIRNLRRGFLSSLMIRVRFIRGIVRRCIV